VIVTATLAVIAAIAVATISWTRGTDKATTRVLVLPFENLTGSGAEDPVADGLTEETIVELGRLDPSRVVVVARTTAMTFKGKRPSLQDLRDALDVDFLVEGSLRRDADTYRTTTQLVDVVRGVPVWSNSFDRRTSDVLFVQQDLAAAIGRQVRIEVTSDTAARLARVRTTNLDAHREYLAGRHAMARGSEEDIRQAIERFERAVALDPGYALAHTGLADASVALTDYYVSPEETREIAKRAAQRAVELEGSLAEAHTSLGIVRLLFEWNWAEAEREFQRAIALQPGYADAHSWYAYYLALMGRADEAVAEVQVAESLDPRSVFMQLNASWVYFLAHKPDDAVAHVKRALEIDPSASVTHSSIWAAYAPVTEFVLKATGDPEHATPLGLATLAGATATAGRSAEAERLLQRLQTVEGYVCPYEIACANAALGKRDEAFRYLEKSYAERSPCLPDLKVDPRFDALRSDPRMQSLLDRMKLR
jgi:TolB-like protein/Tfp pilus assembly protein PilF